jgi:hypothetical protein
MLNYTSCDIDNSSTSEFYTNLCVQPFRWLRLVSDFHSARMRNRIAKLYTRPLQLFDTQQKKHERNYVLHAFRGPASPVMFCSTDHLQYRHTEETLAAEIKLAGLRDYIVQWWFYPRQFYRALSAKPEVTRKCRRTVVIITRLEWPLNIG